jgi:hypothetical protein
MIYFLTTFTKSKQKGPLEENYQDTHVNYWQRQSKLLVGNAPAARPMLLIYLRIYVCQLSGEFRRVKLDSLEARLHPVEQLDKEVELGCRSSGKCD